MEKDEKDGVWRTIRGRRVFIAKGESLREAMRKSGKFERSEAVEAKKELSFDDRANKVLKAKPFSRKQVKEQQKYTSKYGVRGINSYNRNAKNEINLNAPDERSADYDLDRTKRNWNKYSEEQRRELRHEALQDKLKAYKDKKQSNNKIENIHDLIEKNIARDKELEKEGRSYDDYMLEKRTNGKFKSFDDLDKEIDKQSNNKQYSAYNKTMTDKGFEKSQYTLGEYDTEEEAYKDIERQKEIDKSLGIENDYEIENIDNRGAKDLLRQLNDEGSDFTFDDDVEIKDGVLKTSVGVFMPWEDGYTTRELEIPIDKNETYASLEEKMRDWQSRHDSPDSFYDDDFEKELDDYETKKSNPNGLNTKEDYEHDLKWFEDMEKKHPTKDGLAKNDDYQTLKEQYESEFNTKWESKDKKAETIKKFKEKKQSNNQLEKKWEVKSTGGFGQEYGEGNIPIRNGRVDYESHFGALAQDLTLLNDNELKTALETQKKMYDKYSSMPKNYDARTRNGRMTKIIDDSKLAQAKTSVEALEKETLRRKYETMKNYEIYNEGDKYLRDDNRPTNLKYEVDKIMRRIDNANKKGTGYDNKATSDLKRFLVENNNKYKTKEEIKQERELYKSIYGKYPKK